MLRCTISHCDVFLEVAHILFQIRCEALIIVVLCRCGVMDKVSTDYNMGLLDDWGFLVFAKELLQLLPLLGCDVGQVIEVDTQHHPVQSNPHITKVPVSIDQCHKESSSNGMLPGHILSLGVDLIVLAEVLDCAHNTVTYILLHIGCIVILQLSRLIVTQETRAVPLKL